MKKSAKIVSALLVLVLMMAQIVCVNAAAKTPSFSVSDKQTDHYVKTVTLSITNASTVDSVKMTALDEDKKGVGSSISRTNIKADAYSISLKVYPDDAYYVRIVVKNSDGKVLYDEYYEVGGNDYYNIDDVYGKDTTGTYDGLTNTDSSSNGSYNSSSSGSSHVWYYDYSGWNGYRDENRKDSTTYFVTCRTLNVRKGPSTSYDKVGTLSRRTAVEVYSIEKDWAVIMYEGHLRYVSAKYLSK